MDDELLERPPLTDRPPERRRSPGEDSTKAVFNTSGLKKRAPVPSALTRKHAKPNDVSFVDIGQLPSVQLEAADTKVRPGCPMDPYCGCLVFDVKLLAVPLHLCSDCLQQSCTHSLLVCLSHVLSSCACMRACHLCACNRSRLGKRTGWSQVNGASSHSRHILPPAPRKALGMATKACYSSPRPQRTKRVHWPRN
jgi:hypothetical protein